MFKSRPDLWPHMKAAEAKDPRTDLSSGTAPLVLEEVRDVFEATLRRKEPRTRTRALRLLFCG